LYAPSWWSYLVLHSRIVLAISDRTRGISLDAVPRPLTKPGSSSRRLRASPESSLSRLLRNLSAQSSFLGVAFPLGDLSLQRRYGGLHNPSPFRPQRFSRSRRFHPLKALRVCFTPLPLPGFSLEGVPLPHRRAPSSGILALSSVGDSSLLAVAHRRHVPSPRPQGFALCESPLPERRFYPAP